MPKISDFAPADFTPLLASIEENIFRPIAPLRVTAWTTREPVSFKERCRGEKMSLEVGANWGKELFDCAWFLFEGNAAPSGDPLALLIDINGEVCLYDDEGNPLAALTSVASSFDPLLGKPGKRVFWLPSDLSSGQRFSYWGDAGYNDLFGKISGDGKIVEARIAACRENVRHLYFDVAFLIDYLKACVPESPLGKRLKTVLREVASKWLPEDPASADAAGEAVARFWQMKPGSGLLKLTAAGHAHLDLAWLWPEREGRRKAVRTLATALRMAERYPEYRFSASQAQMFAWIKEAEPALFCRIVGAVKKGFIELVGDSWVEADTNISGGEALVRQILEGRSFFQREFGTRSSVLFLPDIFGYSAALPQIAKGCGLDYFTTQKLSWNKVNRFPHQSFWWEGLDGSRVLTHMLPEETYNGTSSPSGLLKAENNYLDIGRSDQALMLFGIGDGGAGPGEEHLENLQRAMKAFGLPNVKHGRVDDFFHALAGSARNLSVWKGELYLENHQGTFTTHAAVKHGNRRAEVLLREVEWLLAAEKARGGNPKEDVGPIWRDILFLQFHDILPGSSIRRVYQEALPVYQRHLERLEELRATLSERITRRDREVGTNGAVINTLPWERVGWIEYGKSWRRYSAPALGRTVLGQGDTPTTPTLRDRKVSNGRVEFTVGPQGGISSLRLADGTEFVPLGDLSAVPRLYHDAGNAWDTPMDYQNTPVRRLEFVSCEEFESEVEAGFVIEWRLDESTIRQRITLRTDSSLVYVDNDIDWRRPWSLLRASFPCAIPGGKANYEIQFGWIERSAHDNTSWDAARHEAPHQQWTDLSNGRKGLAILNDGKYGSLIKENTMELSLMRSVPYPHADVKASEAAGDLEAAFSGLERHRCRFALFPHLGDHVAAGVWRQAREFNLELHVIDGVGGTSAPSEAPLFQWEGSDADFDLPALKISQRGDGVVLRVNRFSNAEGTIEIVPEFPITEAWETNLLEEPMRRLGPGPIHLEFGPFEVKTLLFRTV